MPTFNTMASTPGLGTGLYTTANPSFFRAEDFIDDAALDNTLSDEEDGLDLNLADEMSRIDTAPPTDVPPREGLYSTPLSWERPQVGLRSDPLLSSFNPNTPLLGDMEQQNLLAIALNTNRPPAANFGPGFGGYGFGYGYDVLGGAFPTLGANSLMEGLGSAGLDDLSGPAEQQRPASQPRPQTGLQPPSPLQMPIHQTPARSQHLLSSQVQRPQASQHQHRRQAQQLQPQPQQDQHTQGPPSQATQQPLDARSPTEEQAHPTIQPRDLQRPGSQVGADDLSRSQKPAAADGDNDIYSQEAAEMAEEKGKEKAKPGDRTAHNDIERKYRTNLKDRISELRDSVPALKSLPEEGPEDEDDGAGSRLPKVSKVRHRLSCTIYSYLYHVANTETTGNGPHESNRVHPRPRAEEQGRHARAPGALEAAAGL